MKCAEEAAHGELICNRLQFAVVDFQPCNFFAKLGFKVQWTIANHPRGHSTHDMTKVWPLNFRDEFVSGYDGAAKNLVLEDWDVKVATAQLDKWIGAEAARCHIPVVRPRTVKMSGLKVLNADGSLAAVCIYRTYWNMMYVHILTVAKGKKRHGVGSAVLRKVNEIAQEQGCDYVSLFSMSWQARPFYEKNGFVCIATQKDVPLAFDRHVLLRPVLKAPQGKL
jgi:GNAT superfamily N-acetyltransferase